MQAVLLAAGQSSRFYPFGIQARKSAITLLGLPLVVRTIQSIKKAGITNIVIIVGKEKNIKDILEQHKDPELSITFVEQDEPRGMGDALLKAKEFLEEEFFVLHAHHCEFVSEANAMRETKKDANDMVLLVKESDSVKRFGVIKLDGDRVTDIIEKPEQGQEYSNFRIIGIYLLQKSFLSTLLKTNEEHYSFETALASYAKQKIIRAHITKDTVLSLKYAMDILNIKTYLLNTAKEYRSKNVSIAKNAILKGKIIIDDGVKILDNAVIQGPVYLGKNVFVGNNSIIRDNVSIEEGSIIGANMEVKNSVLFEKVSTHSGFIGDSVIGKNTKIAALFCSGNVRLDRKEITVKIQKDTIDSGMNHLGVMMGENVRIGIRVSTMPGVIIGNNTIVGPGTTVIRNTRDSVRYYTKFQEVVESIIAKSDVDEERDDSEKESEKIVLFDIDYTLFDTEQFKASNLTKFMIYEEVRDVLAELQQIARLGIYSEGEATFQRNKLLQTNVAIHFLEDHLHIVEDKTVSIEEILSHYKNKQTFLIDDKLSMLRDAKKFLPTLFTIWVKRGPFASVQEPFDDFAPDATVDTLHNIVEIVANTN